MGSINASAATSGNWTSVHCNIQGAPVTESYSCTVTIYHNQNGATATCNHNNHTRPTAYAGKTFINCLSYSMGQKSIDNTGNVHCNPNVGEPLYDVEVKYSVMAKTYSADDVFTSKGNITKN